MTITIPDWLATIIIIVYLIVNWPAVKVGAIHLWQDIVRLYTG